MERITFPPLTDRPPLKPEPEWHCLFGDHRRRKAREHAVGGGQGQRVADIAVHQKRLLQIDPAVVELDPEGAARVFLCGPHLEVQPGEQLLGRFRVLECSRSPFDLLCREQHLAVRGFLPGHPHKDVRIGDLLAHFPLARSH